VCMGSAHKKKQETVPMRLEIVEIKLRLASKLFGASP
jgi:hypothetical protein